MVNKDKLLNVGGIDTDDKVLQGIIKFLESGQIVITSVDTDDVRSVTFALANPLNVQIFDGAVGPVVVDGSTFALTALQYPHHEIHRGNVYEFCDIQTVASGSFLHYLIETPDTTEEQHLVWVIKGTTITTVEIFKASTRVGDNSVKPAISNMNHRSENETSLVDLDDAITGAGDDGTRFFCDHGGSAQGNFRASNETASREERILARNAKTYFKIESDTNDNLISVHFIWYEHILES